MPSWIDTEIKRDNFERDLKDLLNIYSVDASTETPDHVLARYLVGCLDVYQRAVIDGRPKSA